jgi:hypothetical protein
MAELQAYFAEPLSAGISLAEFEARHIAAGIAMRLMDFPHHCDGLREQRELWQADRDADRDRKPTSV